MRLRVLINDLFLSPPPARSDPDRFEEREREGRGVIPQSLRSYDESRNERGLVDYTTVDVLVYDDLGL